MTEKTKNSNIDKARLGLALLIAVTFSLTFCFFSVTEVFAGNRGELLFNFRDFAPWILLTALAASLLVTALILLPGKKTGRFVAAFFVWLTLMGFVQSTFLNGAAGLAGDDREAFRTGAPAILNLLIWIAVLAAIVFAVIRLGAEMLKTAAAVLMIMLLGMQVVGFVTNLPRITLDHFAGAEEKAGSAADADDPEQAPLLAASYLSADGMFEAAAENNIYVIVLDRLDVSFIDEIMKKDSGFFAPLTGFTYYRDNLSLYSRTFPGASTIIAGRDADMSGTPEDFFRQLYPSSPLLKDLKDNGFKVRIYASSYYNYRSGSVLSGIADNLSTYSGYSVTRKGMLTADLLLLSAYKALPQLMKPLVKVTTQSFADYVEYDKDSTPVSWNDLEFYSRIKEDGLTEGDYDKSYTYLHFRGGHDPFVIDRNGEKVEKSSGAEQVMGDFTILYKLFDELREKGLYDQATLIVTGDHPRAHSDSEDPQEPRLTALFVKEAGRGSEPFAASEAQVSQENLAATIVRSAGLVTDKDYGPAYSEVQEGEDQVRYHQFELSQDGDCFILRFKVTGEGDDFNNWEIESRTNIGKLYQ